MTLKASPEERTSAHRHEPAGGDSDLVYATQPIHLDAAATTLLMYPNVARSSFGPDCWSAAVHFAGNVVLVK